MIASVVRTRLRLVLFLTSFTIFVFLCTVSNEKFYAGHEASLVFNRPKTAGKVNYFKQKSPRRKPTANDEALSSQFTVQPSSVERSLPRRADVNPKDAVWQTVHSTKSKFLVYSAYLDTRIETVGPLIRIVGVAKTRNPDTVWCRLWYANGSKTVSAHVHNIRGHWHLNCSAVFVLCKLPPGDDRPSSVSIVSSVENPITNELFIHAPKNTSDFKTDVEICVKPFSNDYHYTETQLVEFVEFYYLLGARHFTFYGDIVITNVQCFLDRYQENDLISNLPWHLDMVTKEEIRTGGLLAALSDCLYRHMYTSKYIALVDVDEIIVPKQDDTFIQLINTLELRSNDAPAAYLFPHTFFCTEYPDDESYRNQSQKLVALKKTEREDLIYPHGTRSKFICDPRRVVEAGNHFIWEYVNDATDKALNVPPEVALLHHYRNCSTARKYSDENVANVKTVVDRTIYKYKDGLVDRITKTFNSLDKNCFIEALEYPDYDFIEVLD